MEEVRIDVRDVDYSWYEDVRAFLDRHLDIYYFPRESADRLGEPDEESGGYYFIDGQVEARADALEADGRRIPVWSVGVGQLTTRPARTAR